MNFDAETRAWVAVAVALLALLVSAGSLMLAIRTYARAGGRVRLEAPASALGKLLGPGYTYLDKVRIINDGLSEVQVWSIEWRAATGSEDAQIFNHGTAEPVSLPTTLAKLSQLQLSVLHPSLKPFTNFRSVVEAKVSPLPKYFTGTHLRARLVVTLGTGQVLRSSSFRILTDWREPWTCREDPGSLDDISSAQLPWLLG